MEHSSTSARCRAGFTLVELLLSMAVLVSLVVMVTLIVNSASQTISGSNKHMDADTEARLILNRIGAEIAAVLCRPELDYFSFKQPAATLSLKYAGATQPQNLQSGNDLMAFYSEASGAGDPALSGTKKAPISLISYRINNDIATAAGSTVPVLRRMAKSTGWEPDPSSTANPLWHNVAYLPITISSQWGNVFDDATTYKADFRTVGNQVFRFEYCYLLKPNTTDPSKTFYPAKLSNCPWWDFSTNKMVSTATLTHTSIDGFKDVAAIVVTFAVLDSTSRVIVGDYTKLVTAFPDAQEGLDVATDWNDLINSRGAYAGKNFATAAGIPRSAASAVRIYQRTFYLNGSGPF
jgi:prepilin-type N-terminal cleavage/methylation domain-containing protein